MQRYQNILAVSSFDGAEQGSTDVEVKVEFTG